MKGTQAILWPGSQSRDTQRGNTVFFVLLWADSRSPAISAPQADSSTAPIRRAQLRKKRSGMIRMISSVAGLNSQLSLPGKDRMKDGKGPAEVQRRQGAHRQYQTGGQHPRPKPRSSARWAVKLQPVQPPQEEEQRRRHSRNAQN